MGFSGWWWGGMGGKGGWVDVVGRMGLVVRLGSILTFKGVLTKFNFSMKFPVLEKFVDFMKDLNMNTKTFFPFGGQPNLILRIGRKNQIFFLKF